MSDKNKQDQYDEKWHNFEIQETADRFETDLTKGLSRKEVDARIGEYGVNEISGQSRRNMLLIFLDNFRQPLIYILLIAAAVSYFLGENLDAAVITGVVFVNVIIGFIQESKAEGAISALAKSVVTKIKVIRDGETDKIDSSGIVPGDVVLLSSGDKVPADMRLVETKNLQVNESALTGESQSVHKDTAPVEQDAIVGDRTSMAFAGTLVTKGSGKGIITATGSNTETGKISRMMEESEGLETPLTRKIRAFSKTLLFVILGMSGVMFVLAFLNGIPWVEGFKAAVALAVSAIPEGLPAAITVTLAIGVNRMAQRHAIIRKLPAVEALGGATVICSDKTGTLTQNRMIAKHVTVGEEKYEISGGFEKDGEILLEGKTVDVEKAHGLYECILAGMLCNDSHLEDKDEGLVTAGDPTEGALLILAEKIGLDKKNVEQERSRLDTIPFESEKMYMAVLNSGGSGKDGNTVYVKGALESILERCGKELNKKGETVDLNKEEKKEKASLLAKEGLRVLALAKKEVDGQTRKIEDEDIGTGLMFLGIVGMIDPPRDEAVEAVKTVQEAGIKVKMLTGDHEQTAMAIARKMGIIQKEEEKGYSGKALSGLSDEEFDSAVRESNVFARVAPEHKLRLVKSLQEQGEVVAVTGDGVNDAPALQQSDIGVAMGIMGTEVAKEAADMVLTDDNFSSIAAAVEEGRTVYSNLLKTINFILPVNGGEALTIFAGLLLMATIPLLPVQVLWVNMVSSVALMLTLAFEPKQKGAMERPPYSPQKGFMSKKLAVRVIIISACNLFVTFGMFKFMLEVTGDMDLSRTIAVNTLVAAETFYLLSISDLIPSIFGWFRDRSVKIAYAPVCGVLCLLVIQYVFTQWGVMNDLFHTKAMTMKHLWYCLGAGALVLFPGVILKKYVPIGDE